MIMYYKDMSQITAAGTAFRFRLRKNLAAFPGDPPPPLGLAYISIYICDPSLLRQLTVHIIYL